jgi:hypothetical protein
MGMEIGGSGGADSFTIPNWVILGGGDALQRKNECSNHFPHSHKNLSLVFFLRQQKTGTFVFGSPKLV